MAHDDTAAHLSGGLPDYYPSSPNSGNYKLLQSVADEFDLNEDDIDEIEDSVAIQTANSIDELWEHGKAVDLPPEDGESLEHYRARLLVEYNLSTAEGTIPDIIHTTARILEIDKEDVEYDEPRRGSSEHGTASVGVPLNVINESALTQSDVGEFVDRLAAGGVRIEGLLSGTFTYISPLDYSSDNHDADLGYDGLDSNGDPKGNGGTYAGVIG